MPRQTEPSVNNALGRLLQRMLPTCQVRTETTQAIAGHPGLRPDVLITATGRAPVAIEAEFAPAAHVEAEARERLGLQTAADGRPIEAVVALRYPASRGGRRGPGVRTGGRAVGLRRVHAGRRRSRPLFFPASGWLDGSVENLADLVRLVSVPQHAVGAGDGCPGSGDRPGGHAAGRGRGVAAVRRARDRRVAGHGDGAADVAHGRGDHRQRADLPGTADRDAPAGQAVGPGVRRRGRKPQARSPGGVDVHPQHQLLADFRHCPRHREPVGVVGRGADSAHAARRRHGDQVRGRGQRARPDRTNLSAADRGPQVPGDVLHLAGLGGAAGAAGRRQAGGRGLVGRGNDREAAGRRLRLRHGRAVVGRV